MILYHGSLEEVKEPEIRKANRALDYGSGFYTKTSEEQAILWVKRKLNKNGGTGYVNIYEWNENFSTQLDILHFTEPNLQKNGLTLLCQTAQI